MKKNKKKIIYFLFLFIIPFLAISAEIKGIEDPTGGFLGGDIDEVVMSMLDGLLKLVMPFLVLAYVYVAFLFVKAQGSSEGLQKARKAFLWLVVGTAIIVGSNIIYSVIEDTLSEASIKTVMLEKSNLN